MTSPLLTCVALLLLTVSTQAGRSQGVYQIRADDDYSTSIASSDYTVAVPGDDDPDFCKKRQFRRRTMKLVRESPFVALIHDLKNQSKFEASDLVMLNKFFYVVFDNLRTIARVDESMGDFSDTSLTALIPEHKGDPDEESQFEGISYIPSRNTFLLLRESIRHPVHGQLNPELEEIKISADEKEFSMVRKCLIDFELEAENKGFEGLHYFRGSDGDDMALGLCESNFCRTSSGKNPPGKQRGNGRLVLTRFQPEREDTPCVWIVDKVINIPQSAYFTDYAGFGFGETENGLADVAIVSQEDSAVWIGKWDWKALDFASDKGDIWHLPRDNACNKIYCNVEGVQFMDKMRLALVSDKCKRKQDFTCHAKDQAVHVFALSA